MRRLTAAGLDVLGHHMQAAHQILAALGERRAQQFGVGGEEIRGRQRARHLLEIELRLLARMRLEFVRALDEIVGPARRQDIGLLDEIEIGVGAPLRIGEPLVAGLRRGDRRNVLAAEATQGRSPEIDELPGKRGLRLERAFGVGGVIFGDAAERRDDLGDFVPLSSLGLAGLERLQIGREQLAALLDGASDIARKRFDIGQWDLGR